MVEEEVCFVGTVGDGTRENVGHDLDGDGAATEAVVPRQVCPGMHKEDAVGVCIKVEGRLGSCTDGCAGGGSFGHNGRAMQVSGGTEKGMRGVGRVRDRGGGSSVGHREGTGGRRVNLGG